jgi:GTP cyclohydrolase IA
MPPTGNADDRADQACVDARKQTAKGAQIKTQRKIETMDSNSNRLYTQMHPSELTNGDSTDERDTQQAVKTGIPMPRDEAPLTPEIEPGEESYDAHFEELISQIITRLGEDPARDGLQRTPLRVAKALDFLTSGYTIDLSEVVNEAIFEDDGQEMVLVRDIEFYSLCEHHMLPFFGRFHIAYIPHGKIIGLSKLARVADVFARRLQVQERLTNQIADALEEILQPQGVAVVAEAAHFCMMMRGVQKQNSTTLTSAMRGVFRHDPQQRDYLMRMLGK